DDGYSGVGFERPGFKAMTCNKNSIRIFISLICQIQLYNISLCYKNRTREFDIKKYHIKVDWETHQIFMKYRDKLSCLMAGPILINFGEAYCPGGLQRTASAQILSFGVSSHPLMWTL
ncbi:hypothetical protein, partial [uncultured Muribaculum sp.]|uniref:hypothetical protein n=1 Tax=uncultured Muribaculum sp. TaxID=1918613 RepID=UPI00266F93A2